MSRDSATRRSSQQPEAGKQDALAQDAFAPLRASDTALLTTFRRNGQGVNTVVSIQVANGKAYFTTWSTTGKVKRLAYTPRVTLAPCTRDGTVCGPTIAGMAWRLEGAEAERVRAMLGHRFERWLWKLVYKLVYHAEPVLYEVLPLAAE